MKCPYCAEDIKDEAFACKHCHRDFFIIRPLLDQIKDLTERLATLDKQGVRPPATGGGETDDSPDNVVGKTITVAANVAGTIDTKIPLLSPFAALAMIFVMLVAAHFIIIIQLDLSLIYLRIVSILVPALFGFLYRGGSGRSSLAIDFAAGVAVAILSILAMSAIVSRVDDVPLLPDDASGWREFAEYGASIAFGFFTGVILRYGLSAMRSAQVGSSRILSLVSKYIEMKMRKEGEEDQDDDVQKRLRSIESMISTAIGVGSAVIYVATGLYQFIH